MSMIPYWGDGRGGDDTFQLFFSQLIRFIDTYARYVFGLPRTQT